MSKTIVVYVEYPVAGGSEEIAVDLPDDATDKDADEAAEEVFFNLCSYGWGWRE